jgi:hypothetical protein
MSALVTKSIPDGWHSVTPRLVVDDVPRLVRFLRDAWGSLWQIATYRGPLAAGAV